jgi:K+-transporting ATPase ATPase A chain
MTANAWVQVLVYMGVLVALAKPLGWYMARVYQGQPCGLDRVLGPIERWLYRLAGVDPQSEMSWKTYAVAMLLFNLVGLIAVYLLLRLQGVLPLNPQGFGAATPDLSFNTAVSFATNTNWQSYGGENTLSYLPQMLGLAVQNFVSAASGMAVLIALIRGLVRRSAATIGNFWGDLVRSTVYVLLPLSVVLAIVLVSQGVVQNFRRYRTAALLQPTVDAEGNRTSRDFASWIVNPCSANRAGKAANTGRASHSCVHAITKSSANRIRIASPRNCGFSTVSNHLSST